MNNNKEEQITSENNTNDEKKPKKDINLVGKRLWVTNLDYKFNWQDLKDHFKTAGEVVYANVIKDRNDRSTGSGIVEFKNREDALNAYNTLNYSKIGDSKFFIYIREDREDFETKPKSSRPRNNNFNNNRNNNNNSNYNNRNNNRNNNNYNNRNNSNGPRNNNRSNNSNRSNDSDNNNKDQQKKVIRTKGTGTNKKQIFLGNLPYNISWQDLKDIFSSVGEIEKAHVYLNYAGRSRGNGFVLFKDEKEAQDAIEKYNGMDLNGREVVVKLDEFAN